MGHSRNKLSIKAIQALGPGSHGDGGGLWLRKGPGGNGQWILRYRFHGRPRQMGLGSLSKVSLSQARQIRDEFHTTIANGEDPIRQRQKSRKAARDQLLSLKNVAEDAFKARQAELKADGKAGRWFSPLALHVLPLLGATPIVDIDQKDIRDVLEPIWHDKADTARKALNRLNIVIQHGAALGLDVDVLATKKAQALLGKQRHQPKNIPSMPWTDVPAFFKSLAEPTPVQLALKLLMLNPGPRSKPIRYLQQEQISLSTWTVPGEMLKGAKGKTDDWRLPLSDASLAIIEEAKRHERNGFLFPNVSGRGVISDASMSRLMERRQLAYRPHGFRASFKTWAAETNQRRDIAELCLGHKIYGSVEASYLRTDFLDERRELMNAWSQHVMSG